MTLALPIDLAQLLVVASAAILFALGALHLLFTLRGPAFEPRDPQVRQGMESTSPKLTRETTMWRAWIGFNVSHSLGALLFGALYAYLALAQPELLFHSLYLRAVALVLLATYALLGKRYWFSVPYKSVVLALLLFGVGLVI